MALKDDEEIENNLRFQGQYFDLETGLHYNRHRYYAPFLARFISQDPISLLGGDNNFEYTPNPINWTDPYGLTAKDCEPKLSDDLYRRNPHLRKEIVEEYENIKLGKGTPRVYDQRDLREKRVPLGQNVGDQKTYEGRESKKWNGAKEWDVPGTPHRILAKDGRFVYVTDHNYKNIRQFPSPWFPDGGKPTR